MCYDTSELDKGRYYKNIEKGSSYMYKAFDSSNMARRVKGGSHAYDSSGWNVLSRNVITATYAYNSSGFRIVRTV